MKRVLIGGIGNVLLGDDGVGPYIVHLLDAHYEFDDVEIVDLGTPALDLIDQISGRDAVILIDSVDCGEEPGKVLLYRKEDVLRVAPEVRMDPHSPALSETLLGVELFGESPKEFLLIGVAGESYEAELALTPAVKSAVQAAIRQVLREFDRLNVAYRRRAVPAELDVWWMAGASVA
ncbi:MAG TPA: hydrogenase maturation protease [Terriglobales bacterium]